MAKKIIRLTEEELREIVTNATQQVLSEMAVPIKAYKARVDSLRLQLVEIGVCVDIVSCLTIIVITSIIG